ncbi:flippase [Pontixanthobacter gangjinensis]|uniref:Oligosaccharide flippase family protein n=1 Tax=Pontixanthobacter gangjinensis TaxID=1028742 RepID=A0A6I4SLH4_9SPHN|nr:polysaccharide biosynthesis C-terminal domain-containing protein [Pontixanthobacter gangjinensis]MXO55642.1 oligosaccharide flippase family protein [Pontixanthobacter gangjinensis]
MLRTLIKQAASVAGIRVFGTGLSVLVSVAIARLYGPDALGVYAYCVTLMAIAAVPVSNGWSTMLLRAVSQVHELDSEARAMARLGARLAIVFAAFAAATAVPAVHFTGSEIASALEPVAFTAIGLLFVALLCDQISAMRMASMRGLDRPALAQLPESLVRPSLLLMGVAIGWWAFGSSTLSSNLPILFASLAIAAIASAMIGQLILTRLTGRAVTRRPDPAERKAWFASAAALAGSAGLVQLNGYVDMLILGSYVAPAEVGLYRAALQIAMLASFGYIALNMLAGQRFAKFTGSGDHESLSRTATHLARLALLTAIPLPLILLIAGEDLFALLFGTAFEGASLPALLIAAGFTFSAAIGMARTLLVMQGNEFLVMRTTLVALVLNVVLCILLIPRYGITGAAIANLSANVGWNILLWALARRSTGIDSSVFGANAGFKNG